MPRIDQIKSFSDDEFLAFANGQGSVSKPLSASLESMSDDDFLSYANRDSPAATPPKREALQPPASKVGTLGGVASAAVQGVAESATTELPKLVGESMEFVGSYLPGETVESIGKDLKEWAEAKGKSLYGEPKKREGLERWVYEGSKMLAPSLIPMGVVGAGVRVLTGVGKLVKAGKAAQAAASAAKTAEEATLYATKAKEYFDAANKAAKMANNVASYSTGALFGTAQAQSTRDNAERQAQKLEKEGDFEGARQAREAGQGAAPIVAGAIEAGGEIVGTKYLGKLFRMDEAGVAKRGAKQLVADFMKTLGIEVGTEMGQQGGEALTEKVSGIRPDADPIAEALDVIGPTAWMTLVTGGASVAANRIRRPDDTIDLMEEEKTKEQPDVTETIRQAIDKVKKEESKPRPSTAKEAAETFFGKDVVENEKAINSLRRRGLFVPEDQPPVKSAEESAMAFEEEQARRQGEALRAQAPPSRVAVPIGELGVRPQEEQPVAYKEEKDVTREVRSDQRSTIREEEGGVEKTQPGQGVILGGKKESLRSEPGIGGQNLQQPTEAGGETGREGLTPTGGKPTFRQFVEAKGIKWPIKASNPQYETLRKEYDAGGAITPPAAEISPPEPAGEAVAPKTKGFDPDNDRQRQIFVGEILKSDSREVKAMAKQAEREWPGEDPMPVVESQIDYDLLKAPEKWLGTAVGKEILARKGWGEKAEAPAPIPESEKAGKEPWQMTKAHLATRRKEFFERIKPFEDQKSDEISKVKKARKKFGTTPAEKRISEINNKINTIYNNEFPDLVESAKYARHQDSVDQALSENKPVPQAVLDEYPDLKKAEVPAAEHRLTQKLIDIKGKIDTLTNREEAESIDKIISGEIYDDLKRDNSTLAFNLMKKAELGLSAAMSLNKGLKTTRDLMYQGQVKEFREVLDRAISVMKEMHPIAKPSTPEPAEEGKGKIEDFGEKIGGARKDTAERGYSMSGKAKKEDEGPVWRKKFVAMEKVHEPGKWVIGNASAAKAGMITRFGGQVFSSREEAEKAIPLYAVAQNHSVYQNDDKTYSIYKRVSDRKRLKVVNQDFPSREEAMKYMATHAEDLLSTKTSFGEEILPVPEIAIRKGAERRTADATREMFIETFAPRGIEFGNWNNQEERQQVMNHAYDGLLDLADALGLPPKALMLNGELAIAFGARGQGLSGAKAHYETDYGIINLTKMKGAGSLAHEWMHALDHYFGRQDIPSRSEKVTNKKGDKVYKTTIREPFASQGFARSDSGIRQELRKKYESLLESMYKRAEQYVEDTKQADKFLGTTREQLAKSLNDIRNDLSRDLTNYHKSKGGYSSKPIKFLEPASAEQLAEFDRLASILIEGGDLETKFMSTDPAPGKPALKRFGKERPGAFNGRHTNDTLESINTIIKAARNHQGFNKEQTGLLDKVRAAMGTYKARLKMFEDAQAGTEKTRMRPTSYAIEAKKMDQARTGNYWSEPHEMAARAFAAYVEDKIAEKGGQSDFLVYHAHGGIILPMIDGFIARPYPEGAERESINKEFDKFISAIQTRETPQGVEMYAPGMVPLIGKVQLIPSGTNYDLLSIKNRRFMYNPKTDEMVLGGSDIDVGTHGDDLKKAEPKGEFRDFIRGWFGTNRKEFKSGIIHFSPALLQQWIDSGDFSLDAIKDTVRHFIANGANEKTKTRNLLVTGESTLGELFPDIFEGEGDERAKRDGTVSQATEGGKFSVRDQHRRGALRPAKLEDVKRFFPGQEVGLDANKNIYVKTRGGKYVTIYRVDHIEANPDVLTVGYGVSNLKPGQVIPGAMGVTPSGEYYIKLHRVFADTWTLAHEGLGHFTEVSGLLNSRDIDVLKNHIKNLYRNGRWEPANRKDVGGPEDRANFIADRLAVKEQKGPIGRIVLRIRAFIDGILESFGVRSPEGILRGIESGKIFERTGREGRTEKESYAVGQRLREADIPVDDVHPKTLSLEGTNRDIISRAAEEYRSWPEKLNAADGSEILLANPQDGYISRRAMHLVWDNDKDTIHIQKAKWLPNVPDTLKNAAVRIVDKKTDNRIYVREYKNKTRHMVIVSPDGTVIEQESFTGKLITQFPYLKKGLQEEMVIDWERDGIGRSQGNPNPTSPVSTVPGPRQETFQKQSTPSGEKVKPEEEQYAPAVVPQRIGALMDSISQPGMLQRRWDEFIYQAQDRFHYLNKTQIEAARRDRAELPESQDAYLAETRYHGMAAAAIEDFDEKHVDPLVTLMSENNIDVEQADEYLHARHAKEANARLRKINPDRKDNQALSGMTDRESEAILERINQDPQAEIYKRIGLMVDAITKARRELLVEAGLETEDTIAAWEEAYRNYVPLHREGKGEAMPRRGRGFEVRGGQKIRAGSTREVVNILANVVAQHEATIVRAEKVKVERAFLEFAKTHDGPWKIDVPEKVASFDADGLIQYRANPIGYMLADNVLAVRVDGKDHHITFDKSDLDGMKILSAMKNLDAADMGGVTRAVAKISRWLAIVNTSLNPEFIISNFARDIQTAAYNMSDSEADAVRMKAIRQVGSAFRGIRDFQADRMDTEWAGWFNRFRNAGAQTGWMQSYETIRDREKALIKKIEDMKPGKIRSVKRGLTAAYEHISNMNTAVENAVRLSVFKNLIEAGVPESKSARIAKELTVNFNRRGNWGPALNAFYLFYNASIQGSARIIVAGAKSRKVRMLMGATVVFAAALDILNRVIGGDDDDGENRYDKIAPWIKDRNLIVMLPGLKGHLQIPLPWGYNVFHVMGQAAGEVLTKKNNKATKSALRVGGAIVSAFNPVGGESSLLQTITPTILDPYVQWTENKDWSGRKIRPDANPFSPKPDSQKYWSSVRAPSKWITDQLNTLTGGDKVRPGKIDFSPEAIDLTIDTITGGAGKFVANLISTPIKYAKGEDVESYEIPFLRRLYGKAGKQALTQQYYENMDSVRLVDRQLSHYKNDPAKVRGIVKEYNAEVRMISRMKATQKAMKDLKDQREAAEKIKDPEVRKAREKKIEEVTQKIMNGFNRYYNLAKEKEK